ncbi:hypothetical protein DAI22_12g083000 [Oryza sativa Japonica Group]|nr:hypothetical protein DAI22_12g083000 [Oryza sativa Japonica Group]
MSANHPNQKSMHLIQLARLRYISKTYSGLELNAQLSSSLTLAACSDGKIRKIK